MSLAGQAVPARSPRWDRNRVLFEINTGGQWIECAISREALQDASGRRYGKPLELLACFSKVRPRLERIALAKYMARSETMGAGDYLVRRSGWSATTRGRGEGRIAALCRLLRNDNQRTQRPTQFDGIASGTANAAP
jgi:Protein of unknown function (DUF1488)